MRRTPRVLPLATSAVWTRRLGLFGAALALVAVALPKRDGDATAAVALLGVGLMFAVLALFGAVAAAASIWRTGFRGVGRVLAGLVLSLLTLAYPTYLAARLIRDNPAADVTTDRDDPPRFTAPEMAARTTGSVDLHWLLGRGKPAPDVDPVTFDQDASTVYRIVLKTATQMRWRVVSAVAPTARTPVGHVDAVTQSALMRLPVWIAIRIMPQNGRTRVDLRAVAPGLLPLTGDDPLRDIQSFADAIEEQDGDS